MTAQAHVLRQWSNHFPFAEPRDNPLTEELVAHIFAANGSDPSRLAFALISGLAVSTDHATYRLVEGNES